VSFFKLAHNSPVHETFFRQYHPFRHAWRSFVAQIPCPQLEYYGLWLKQIGIKKGDPKAAFFNILDGD
jgi:hypothetical protein